MQPKLEISKRPDGKLAIKGLRIWSVGTFRGYGSPKNGDQYTQADLDKMAQAHKEIGAKLDPRAYPGHPLNPGLKLFARPQGHITDIRREGDFLLADLDGVNETFWQKAQEDQARFSPDVKFNHLDPDTGKTYPLAVVGLGVLGAAQPANTKLPSLGQYETTHYYASRSASYAGDLRSYADGFDAHGVYRSAKGVTNASKEDNHMPNDEKKELQDLKTQVESAIAEENTALEEVRAYTADLEAQLAEMRTAREEDARRIASLQAVLEGQLTATTLKDINSYADSLVENMKAPPAVRDGIIKLLIAAAGVENPVKSYALDDLGEAGEKTLFALAQDLFSAWPAVEAKPVDKSIMTQPAQSVVSKRSYAAEDAKGLAEEVRAYAAEHGIHYKDAFRKVWGAKQSN